MDFAGNCPSHESNEINAVESKNKDWKFELLEMGCTDDPLAMGLEHDVHACELAKLSTE